MNPSKKPLKILYIESKSKNISADISKEEIKKLPKKIFLAYTIQFKDLAIKLKQMISSQGIKIIKFQQVLGCSKIRTKYPVLLIGQGRFHAINLFLQAPEIFLFENHKIIKISAQEIQSFKNKRQTALLKFLSASSIGILVSTKPGQENLNSAIQLKEKLKQKAKSSFIFLSGKIDTNQFENFSIDSWINTACPGLAYDNPNIINLPEVPKSF